MLVSSTATMTADPATAYAAFHDEKILAATIPGVESFTRTGESNFDVVLTMGVAAIKGTYKGTVAFSEEVEDTSFMLSAKGAGGPGTIGADISVALAPGETAAVTSSGKPMPCSVGRSEESVRGCSAESPSASRRSSSPISMRPSGTEFRWRMRPRPVRPRQLKVLESQQQGPVLGQARVPR